MTEYDVILRDLERIHGRVVELQLELSNASLLTKAVLKAESREDDPTHPLQLVIDSIQEADILFKLSRQSLKEATAALPLDRLGE